MGAWLNNPKGAYGFTDLQTVVGNFSIPMKAAAAVTAKSAVQWATTATSSGQIVTALTNGTLAAVIGVALEDIAAGGVGNVAIMGAVDNVYLNGSCDTLFTPLKRSATTAGRLASTTTGSAYEVIGYALSTTTATTASIAVWLYPGRAFYSTGAS